MANKKVGPYHLIEKIDQGGMAEIYLARRVGPHGFEKIVAIKRILPHLSLDKDFLDMFSTEAKVAAQLQHQNIVQIYDYGYEDSTYYIAMEYIHGLNLNQLMSIIKDSGKKWSLPIIFYIIKNICAALHYAHFLTDLRGHRVDIVHRDINPKNIMIAFSGEVKLMDFGIALAATRAFQTIGDGVIKGKLMYLSPEQVQSQPLDHRSDIFSLGIVFYELATGRKPFRSQTEFGVLSKIEKSVHTPPIELNSSLPIEINDIIERCLERNPSRRYHSAGDLLGDITTFEKISGDAVDQPQFHEFLKTHIGSDIINSPMLTDEKAPKKDNSEQLDIINDETMEDINIEQIRGISSDAFSNSETKHQSCNDKELKGIEIESKAHRTQEGISTTDPLDNATPALEIPDILEKKSIEDKDTDPVKILEEATDIDALFRQPTKWERIRFPLIVLLVLITGTAAAYFFVGQNGLKQLFGLLDNTFQTQLVIEVTPKDASIEIDHTEQSGNPITTDIAWQLNSKHRISFYHHTYLPTDIDLITPSNQQDELSVMDTNTPGLTLNRTDTGYHLTVEMMPEYLEVKIISEPSGAGIKVNDIDTGKITPMTYSFPTKSESKVTAIRDGFKPYTVSYQPSATNEQPILNLNLEKVRLPTPTPKPTGRVLVKSPYPVNVYLGKRRLASSITRRSFTFLTGNAHIRIENQSKMLDRVHKINVTANKTSVISVEPPGTMIVAAEPAGCDVIIQKRVIGQAPGQFDLAPGMYNVKFQWSNCQDIQSRWVKINSGQNRRVPKVQGCR